MAIGRMVNVEEDNRPNPFSSLGFRLVMLSSALLAVGVVAIALSVQLGGVSFSMALLAFVVCAVSTLLAHVAGEYPAGDDNFAARLALSMAVRTGPPFLLVILMKLNSELPLPPGFVVLIVLFYIVGLAVDVSLQSYHLKQSQ